MRIPVPVEPFAVPTVPKALTSVSLVHQASTVQAGRVRPVIVPAVITVQRERRGLISIRV